MDEGQLTRSGKIAAKFPLGPLWYHAIGVGANLGCSMNLVDIAVLCNTSKPILARPPGYEQVADVAHGGVKAPSDHLTLENAFNFYMIAREKIQDKPVILRNWCLDHFLDQAALEEAIKTRAALGPFLKHTAQLAPTRVSTTDFTTERKALAIAFCTRTAIRYGGVDEYRTVHENVAALLEPTSALVSQDFEWVVFNKLVMSGGRVYLEVATPINAEWLVVSVHRHSLWYRMGG